MGSLALRLVFLACRLRFLLYSVTMLLDTVANCRRKDPPRSFIREDFVEVITLAVRGSLSRTAPRHAARWSEYGLLEVAICSVHNRGGVGADAYPCSVLE